ncbi:urea amidolyase family protein [Nesterenkonia muleiensis]|uniref:5-oxoprolinase subunit B/C family protein n=1 Tax=Nesterenkonia muleiensis TaxID=2282648 RepID=UPI000E72D357|nr:urea amidolyase family protein [Nesterenkonia muleiensis]
MPDSVRPAGQRALLAEFGTPAEVLAFHRQLSEKPVPGQLEVIPAARTVLVAFRTRHHTQEAAKQLRRMRTKPANVETGRELEIRVHYDGADLERLASDLDMSPQAFIDWHSSTRWVGAFAGFAPGFTYCLPHALAARRRPRKSEQPPVVPRLKTPRTEVPAGAVALGGEFSAVYPRASPGGWQLIGTTDASMWDIGRRAPALVRPGDTVRYLPTTEIITVTEPKQGTVRGQVPAGDAVVDVLSPGPQTLIQDAGRPGHSGLGVPHSGAADAQALRQANQLVGNDESAAGFEVLYGGLELSVRQTSVLAVTGAQTGLEVATPAVPETSNMAVSGTGAALKAGDPDASAPERVREVPLRAPFLMYPGERLRLAPPERGIRNYVAVSGGLASPTVLDSASTDLLSGLGPAPVSAGETFALVGVPSGFVGIADVARTALPEPETSTRLRFVPGPREDWFAAKGANPGLEVLQSLTWEVSEDSNRIGIRLTSPTGGGAPPGSRPAAQAPEPPIQRTHTGELPSEPVVRGAIQIPGSGEPIVFLADHPVTAGYPVIGVVVREDLGLAAQLPPGTRVRFQAVTPDALDPLTG